MNKLVTEHDRSRSGHLVHDATSSGRIVDVVTYIEGLEPGPRMEVRTQIVCRTAAQAAEVARVLRVARFGGIGG